MPINFQDILEISWMFPKLYRYAWKYPETIQFFSEFMCSRRLDHMNLESFWNCFGNFQKKSEEIPNYAIFLCFFWKFPKYDIFFDFFLKFPKIRKNSKLCYMFYQNKNIYMYFFHTFMYTYKKIKLYLRKFIVCRTLQLPCRNSWFLFVYVIVLWAFIMFYDLYAFDHMQSTQAQLPMQQQVGSNLCCSSLS